jgi:hypothetical protein
MVALAVATVVTALPVPSQVQVLQGAAVVVVVRLVRRLLALEVLALVEMALEQLAQLLRCQALSTQDQVEAVPPLMQAPPAQAAAVLSSSNTPTFTQQHSPLASHKQRQHRAVSQSAQSRQHQQRARR